MKGVQLPRLCSVPGYLQSSGQETIELAALAGLELDEAQRFVLLNSMGELSDGSWAAWTVGLVAPRQNGKNAILEARELAGLFLLGERTIIHSAHEQATSSEHFRRLLSLIEGVREFSSRVKSVSRGKGAEAIELLSGQRILFKTRTGGGGRGFSVDLLVFDEAMILSPGAKAALIPTQAARSMDGMTQTWYAGSAVDQLNTKHDGVELARVRASGIAGEDRIAYFEWSVDFDDPGRVTQKTLADRELWAQANSALGTRISEDWIEHELLVELGPREFAVERLGIGDWPAISLGDTVIPLEAWAAGAGDAGPADPVVLCFDVAPDRSSASISAVGSGPDGKPLGELIEFRRGASWVVARVKELAAKHRPSAVLCDAAGAAGSLVYELDQAGVRVETVNAREHAEGCGMLFDLVEQGGFRHRGQPELEQAIRSAKKRPLGGAWAWDRKTSSADISPLVSMTIALWGHVSMARRAPRVINLATVEA